MKQQRIVSLDLIRMVAILLVITQHAWTGLQLDEPTAGVGCYFYHALVVMGVPLFFMLSGALMLTAEPLSIGDFLKRRLKRLLLPFVLWATLIYVISVAMHKYPEIGTLEDALRCYLPYMLTDKINASYWYVFVLIGVYLLTPFLQRALLAPQARQLVRYGLALWIGWVALRAYYPQFGSMRYYSASAFMYMGFYLCGHCCVCYLTNERINRRIGLLGFITFYALDVNGLVAEANVTLVHVMATVSLFLLLKSCSVPHKGVSFVTSAGRYTYFIYFFHVLVVSMFCMLNIWGWCPLWLCPIGIALLAFVISYSVAYIIDHIRFVPKAWLGI